MTKRQVEALVAEIQLYLETVETFRSQGSEPRWRSEPSLRASLGAPKRRKVRRQRGSPKPREAGT